MSEHELWNELGNLYFMTGTYNQAAYAYNRSIQLDSGFGRPYCNLALTYVKQGRYQDAVALYQRSLELLADNTEKAITWYRLGDVYRHLKDYRDAIMAYQQADELDASLSQERKESGMILYGGAEPNPDSQAAAQEIAPMKTAIPEPVLQPKPEMTAEAAAIEESALDALEVETAPVVAEAETMGVPEDVGLEDIIAEAEEHAVTASQAEEDIDIPLPVDEITNPILSVENEPAAAMEDKESMPVTAEEPVQAVEAVREPLDPAIEAPVPPLPEVEVIPVSEPEPETPPMEAESPVAATDDAVELNGMADLGDQADEPIIVEDEAAEPICVDTRWDDDYLVSSFEHETEVYIPDYQAEDLDQWLPLTDLEPINSQLSTELEDVQQDQTGLPPEEAIAFNGASYSEPVHAPSMQQPANGEMMASEPQTDLALAEEYPPTIFIIPEDMEEEQVQVGTVMEPASVTPTCNTLPDMSDEELEQLENEIAKFKQVVQAHPYNASAWDTLGTLYKSARRYRDAILAYQQAVSVDPSKAPYHHHLGIIYAIEGREEDAMKAFQEVIQIDPNHSLANASLGGYYRKMGLDELAQKHIGKAMKNFYNSENEYNRACLEALCGNIEQSIELLRIALKTKQTYVDWVLRDPDLDSIRRDPRFKQLISDYTR